jgi:hypothetical protein
VTWLLPLLYFASFGALLVLFASSVFVVMLLAVKLRRRLIWLLAGTSNE